jgi:hypothetical protein
MSHDHEHLTVRKWKTDYCKAILIKLTANPAAAVALFGIRRRFSARGAGGRTARLK